jgi:hypothetical protein
MTPDRQALEEALHLLQNHVFWVDYQTANTQADVIRWLVETINTIFGQTHRSAPTGVDATSSFGICNPEVLSISIFNAEKSDYKSLYSGLSDCKSERTGQIHRTGQTHRSAPTCDTRTASAGITVTDGDITLTSFTAAVAGTPRINPSGSYGYFAFNVRLTKGASSVTAANLKGTIIDTEVTYAITCQSYIGGTVTCPVVKSPEGLTVFLNIDPDPFFELVSITATTKTAIPVILSGSGDTRSFVMPAAEVTVIATFRDTRVGEEPPTDNAVIDGEQGEHTGSPLRAWMLNGTLHVSGLTQGQPWTIHNLSGVCLHLSIAEDEKATATLPERGLYIVTSGNRSVKVIN